MPIIVLVIVIASCKIASAGSRRRAAGIASLALATGIAFQTWFYIGPIPSPKAEDARGIRELYRAILEYARSEGRRTLKFSADFVGPLSVGYGVNFSATEFERSRRLVGVVGGLMQDGLAAEAQSAAPKLANSDAVLLDDGSPPKRECLPSAAVQAINRFDASVASFRPVLREFVARNFILAGNFEVFCRTVFLWVAVRPVRVSASASPQPDRSLLSEFGPGWRARTATRDHAAITFSYLRPVALNSIEIASLPEAPAHSPRSFRLMGSNDMRSWDLILDVAQTGLSQSRQIAAWSVPPHAPFLHLRLEAGGLGDDGHELALGHVRLGYASYGSLQGGRETIDQPPQPNAAARPSRRGLDAGDGVLPRLVDSVERVNLVDFAGLYYGVPRALGKFELNSTRVASMPGILVDTSLDGLTDRILDAAARDADRTGLPRLLLSERRYNIVAYRGRVYAVPQALGRLDWQETDVGSLPGVIVGSSVGAVRAILHGS